MRLAGAGGAATWSPAARSQTAELVVSLRNFIREALDLAPMPADVAIPMQGPTRPAAGGRGGQSRARAVAKAGAAVAVAEAWPAAGAVEWASASAAKRQPSRTRTPTTAKPPSSRHRPEARPAPAWGWRTWH